MIPEDGDIAGTLIVDEAGLAENVECSMSAMSEDSSFAST
jgi:hypothetical protein